LFGEEKMVKDKKELHACMRIIAPVGDVPSTDRDLQERIKKLSPDATVSDVFKEIGKWEKNAVKKFRERERTTKSGRLGIHRQ